MAEVIQLKNKKKWWGRWQFWLVLLIVLALGAGLFFWWQGRDKPGPYELEPVLNDAQNLAFRGDFEGAHDTINQELAKSNLTAQQKYDLYLQQGSTYYNQRRYDQALVSFKRAAEFAETQSLYNSMADAAELLGDKPAAVTYLRRAIELIPSSSPMAEADRMAYEAHIEELEAGGGQQ